MSATASDSLLQAIIWLCAALLFAVALAFVVLFALRIRNQKRQQQLQEQQQYWQQLLFSACDPNAKLHFDPERLRQFKQSTPIFLWLIQKWSLMHHYVRGDADDGLQQFADTLKLQTRIVEHMQTQHTRRLIACCLALGDMQHLGSSAVIRLTELTEHNSSMVVLTALRALMRFDPKLALSLLLKNPHYIAPERLVTILKECPPNLVTEATCATILQDNPQHAHYLLRVLKGLQVPVSKRFITTLLERFHDNNNIISMALSLLSSPELLPLVRDYTTYDNEGVRVQATSALARLAEPEDEARLWQLVCDASWWVRYRAAEGLFELPFLTVEQVLEKAEALDDNYAQTMLEQVATEVHYGVL